MTDPDPPRYRRVVRRSRAKTREKFSWASVRPADIWTTFKAYFGLGRAAAPEPIDSPAALARFLDTRASFIAQTSLYGYLRTRAGMRYPELFDDDPFVEGINIAKWHIWLDCLGDLTAYAGARLSYHAPREMQRIASLMSSLVDGILASKGQPPDAGGEYATHAARLRDRVARTDWLNIGDKEEAFTDSPASVVHWSPVIEELKQLDEEIVRNSVRYRWQEVRRHFVQYADMQALLARLPPAD